MRYDSFISDFWKKRYDEVELSLNELPEEIKEELHNHRVRYNYFV